MKLENLKLAHRLILAFGIALSTLVLSLAIALTRIDSLHGDIEVLVGKSFPKAQWANILDRSAADIGRALRNMLLFGDDAAFVEGERATVLKARENAKDALDKLTQAITSDEGKQLLERVKKSWQTYVDGQEEFLGHIRAGQNAEAKSLLFNRLRHIYRAYLDDIDDLVKLQNRLVMTQGQDANDQAQGARNLLLLVGFASLALSAAFAFWLIRTTNRQLGADPGELRTVASAVAQGKLDIVVGDAVQGSVLAAVKDMLQSLRAGAAEAANNARIKSALDNVAANVMIADGEFNIIYMNQAVGRMFQAAEADIRKELPQFDARNLLGGSIDRFHKNPAHQRAVLARLTDTYRAQIALGGRTLTVVANPVMNEKGERLGSVVEWQDITVELARSQAEQKLAAENARIRAALDSVSSNVQIADADCNIIYMNKAVMQMFEVAEADIRKQLPHFDRRNLMGQSIDRFHKNPGHQRNLLATLNNTYRAQIVLGGRTFALTANPVMNDKGERLGAVVEWADRTNEVAVENEVANLVQAAGAGDFSQRIPLTGKEGFFKNLAEGLNGLMDISAKGLNDVAQVLGAISSGDLTSRITADYQGTFGELKSYSNNTVDSLSMMMRQIRESAMTVTSASSEIAAGNSDLSARTEQQAANLEETASSMEELTSTVKQNADNARQANQLAQNASQIAVKGGSVVGDVVTTMTAINDSARKIADIISVIDGIAFQTNILALNAAVEAARAGEQGRGFAVVAGEVRNLAQRSAAAAKEIKTLITDSVDKVESGNKLVATAGATMADIVAAIQRVTDIMSEIAAASEEQSSGIEQINAAITQMDEMTQQNAALVEQASAAAESLREQADSLAEAVAVFRFDSAGTHVAALPARAETAPAQVKTPRLGASKPAARKPAARKAKADDDWEEF